jgi:hypothetical protein
LLGNSDAGLDPVGQVRVCLQESEQQLGQGLLIQVGQKVTDGRAFVDLLRLVDKGQEDRYDVLAEATPIVETRAMRFKDTASVQFDGDLVRLIAAALHLGQQGIPPTFHGIDSTAMVVILAAVEGLGRRQSPDVRFGQSRFGHGSSAKGSVITAHR